MKSCLGIIFIFIVLAALIATVAYNYFANESLHFERRDSQPAHVNPRRTERVEKPSEKLQEVIAVPESANSAQPSTQP